MMNIRKAWQLLLTPAVVSTWLIAAALSVLEFYVALVIGNVNNERNLRASVWLLVGLALCIFTGRTVIAAVQHYFSARSEQKIQERLIAHFCRMPEDRADAAANLHYLTVEAKAAARTFLFTLSDIIAGMFSLLAALIYGLTISWVLTVAMLLLCGAGVIVPRLTAKNYHVKQDDVQAQSTAAQDVFVNFMAGRSVFNAFDAGHYALHYFHQHFAKYTQAQYAAGMSRVNIETTSVGMGFFFDIVILGVELLFVGLGQIAIFQYAALAILTPNYTWLFYSFPAEFASFIEGLTPAVRIQDSLAVPLPPVADSAPLQLNPVRLRTADLQFTYPDGKTPVLQNVNFSVGLAAHEKILISGESGGGKTSLLKVLLGDYQPSAGRVQLEYADGTQTQMTASEIGYVPQANELIAGDLRSNILLGRSLSTAAYQGILEQVGLNDLAATLDRNHSGSLTGLSAGQLQKVGIARALVSGRPLLIMDEPFANLDETAKGQLAVILSNLDAAVIVVSHQFDFAPFWQRHLVLTRGVLMEAGQ